ncbi:hypothetical protein PV797_14000 [Clostridiaceae bacterium M8S5]|nr:hypothetical protein PV797_14000 [Clostridiaceae bacterium M8S5]
MREIISLTKLGLINMFGFGSLNLKKMNREQLRKLLITAVIMIFIIFTYRYYLKFLNVINLQFIAINQINIFNALIYSIESFIIFIFSIPYVMAYYFFSRETEMFLSLPIKPRNIIWSKFNLLLIYEYIIVFLTLAPAFIINGINTNAVGSYYFIMALALLIIPVFPLALSTIIIILSSRIINLGNKKNLIRGIFLFLMTFVAIGLQIYIQKYAMAMGQGGNFVKQLLENNETLVNLLGKTNILAKWLGNALSSTVTIESLINFALFALMNVLIFVVFLIVGDKVYLGGIIGGNEVVSKKKQLSKTQFNKEIIKAKPPYFAVCKIDVITILKTPIYLFNCYSVVIILPIIFMIPIITGINIGNFNQLISSIPTGYINFSVAGIIMAMCAITPVASTTFSREGKYFWTSRIIPTSAKDQIIGRSLSALIPQFLLLVLMIVGLNISMEINMTVYIGMLLGIIGSELMIIVGMFVDIGRPLLNWTNPQRAVKQNMNVMISLVVNAALLLAIGALTVFMIKSSINTNTIFLVDFVVILILTYVFYKKLEKKIIRKFVELE